MTAKAQEIVVRRYSELDGLPSSRVFDIAESPAGTMWFATRSGLFEYDGTSWALTGLQESGPAIQFVRFDADGQAWGLRADGRVVSTSPHVPEPMPSVDPDRSAGFLHDFAIVSVPRRAPLVAVATAHRGLLVWQDGEWVSPDLDGAERSPRALASWSGGLLCGTVTGLRSFGSAAAMPSAWIDRLPAGPVRGLSVDRDANGPRLWIVGTGWIGVVTDGDRFELLTEAAPPLRTLDESPVCIVSDGLGGVIYGNPLAIYQLDGRDRSTRRMGTRQGLGVEGVNALLRDRNGLIWGASPLGAFKIVRLDAATYTSTEGLLESEVSAVARLPDGRIVLGHPGGLTIDAAGKRDTLRFEGYDEDLPVASRVMDLCLDADGQLIVAAAGRGVGRLMPDHTVSWTPIPDRAGAWANAVHGDGAGGILVGTPRGLYRWNEDFEPVGREQLGGTFVRRIEIAGNGTIYLATPYGVWIGRGDFWDLAQKDTATSGFDHAFTCYVDGGGRVWCGCGDGLWQVMGGQLVRPAAAFDVVRPVYSIVEGHGGRLWFGTDLGFRYSDGDRLTDLAWMAPQTGREANRAAALIDLAGRVWLGTNDGVTVIEPSFDVSTPPPTVELFEVRIGPDAVALTADIELDTGRADIRFSARALSFLAEDQIEFRHRVVGLDDWETSVGATVLEQRYSGLPPGSFVFEVQARAPSSDFSAIVRSPRITVLGPVWARWWFMLLVVGGSGTLGVALYRTLSLRTVAARLETEVSERTRELEVSLRELAKTDRLRSLGLIGGGIAHDLRNMLTVMSGNLELLAAAGDDEAGRKAALQAVDLALDRANQLAAQLQTFATGGSPVTRETSMDAIVRDSAAIVVSGAAFGVDIACDADLWPAEADAVQIRQVIENLLVNARQAQPEGGAIRVRATNVELIGSPGPVPGANDLPPGRYVALTISDDGPGIPPEIAGRIFDPFFTTTASGSGLGLATALSIVRRHGGTLTLESGTGGATFRLLLPAASVAAPKASDAADPLSGDPRVLVVDDESSICRVLCQLLGIVGYDAAAAQSSQAARELVEQARDDGRPFGLAIIDLTLPGDLSGSEILHELRKVAPDLRAIATSGYSDDTVMSQYREHGFQGVLPKPYRLEDLREAMQGLVGAGGGRAPKA